MTTAWLAAACPRLQRRLARLDDDRGSIALLLLVVLVGAALGGLLVPMIITQDRTTRFDTTRVQALDAAQAGLDVMLGNIRRATNGDSDPTAKGDASKLPCPTSPIGGNVSGGPGNYSVSVVYFSLDPFQNPSATIPCSTSGTLTGTAVPGFARVTSIGTVPPAVNGSTNGRTLTNTYQFHNTNEVGGIVPIYPASATSSPLCMDAGSATSSNGYLVLMQACSTANPPLAQQVFNYRNDLTIQLASSVTATNTNGLCLSQPTGSAVRLSTCQAPGTATPPPFAQQWSYNPNGAFQTTVARSIIDGSLGSQCINLASQVAGSQLTLATCNNAAGDTTQSWTNSPTFGLGAATLPQWTNYAEFGRCLYISATGRLWSYPCTQDPWAGAVPAGQSFTVPPLVSPAVYPVGSITSGSGATQTCLASPTSGGAVTASACSTGSLQTWTVYNGLPATYSGKYTVVNGNGLCLGLGTPVAPDKWSVVQTETCTGAADQKWNVPVNALSLTLQTVEK